MAPPYEVLQLVSSDPLATYKLIQLPEEILLFMKDTSDQLELKALPSQNDLVLCTPDKTWKVRQMNHSNTVLLLHDTSIVSHRLVIDGEVHTNMLLGLALTSYEYELTVFDGHIDVSAVPEYSGHAIKQSGQSIEQLLSDSPISKAQFLRRWHALGGCNVDGQAVLLSTTFMSEVLLSLVPVLISNRIAYDSSDYNLSVDQIRALLATENLAYSYEVVETVLNKFGEQNPDDTSKFRLNNSTVSKWFGIQTLINNRTRLVGPKDFLLIWKSALPPFYNVPIDLSQLRGHFYRPITDKIQYLDPAQLLSELAARVKELFKLVREWDWEDFLPYIAAFVPSGKKPELFILKYARRNRVGKRYVVSPR